MVTLDQCDIATWVPPGNPSSRTWRRDTIGALVTFRHLRVWCRLHIASVFRRRAMFHDHHADYHAARAEAEAIRAIRA
ncbi:hypothetical protein, partial [Staphylococcus borealis]|uniref:hypothetical protein n=1 Tax=Staphylococcus borealis TaxID=2742203 RepID=UPI0039ED88EC